MLYKRDEEKKDMTSEDEGGFDEDGPKHVKIDLLEIQRGSQKGGFGFLPGSEEAATGKPGWALILANPDSIPIVIEGKQEPLVKLPDVTREEIDHLRNSKSRSYYKRRP
jgi:hypothetical protein